MKGKLTKLMMVAMVLVMAMSLATTALTVSTTTVSAATDKWSRMDLPTTLNYQMFPDSAIWDLAGADDGTLFALVEDTTGGTDIGIGPIVAADWDGLRWAVYPAYSDVALFKSTDGGCSWTLCWHMPSSELGAPIAVVPQPGYKDGDTSNDAVFIATGARYIAAAPALPAPGLYAGSTATGEGNIYRSLDGCNSFTRVTPRCPGVVAGGWITSMDVAQCPVCTSGCQNPYMAIVGVSSLGATTLGEGVYTWNDNGIPMWNDLQVSDAMPPAPTPGTVPAGSGLDVIEVYASRNFPTDGVIVAVVNDIAGVIPTPGVGLYVCFYDRDDGIWGGDIDSPTNACKTVADASGAIWTGVGAYAADAAIDTGTDFSKVASCYVFVGLSGCVTLPDNDVWRVRGLPTVTGPSTVTSINVYPLFGAYVVGGFISDVMISGEVSNPQAACYVGCEWPYGQAQTLSCYNLLVWPGPVPSFKPTSGAWPVIITDAAGIVFAAGGGDGATTSGVHKMAVTTRGPVWNGIGLLDDIAVSEDIPGNTGAYAVNPTSWTLAEAVSEEVSPTYASDGLIYVGTWSEWTRDLSLWRLTDGCWERIMYEDIRLPGNIRFESKQILTNLGQYTFANADNEIWWPRVVPQFSTDQSMFLLGGRGDWATPGIVSPEMIWYSPDKGNDWRALPQMPIGAANWVPAFPAPAGTGLSEMGWWAQDSNTLFMGDVNGFIYKTTNRGASWTDGTLTGTGLEIDCIRTSPIYSDAGTAGTDKYIIVGTYDTVGFDDEVWLSEDGCSMKDLENIGDPIYVSPAWGTTVPTLLNDLGHTVVNFDKNWASNRIIYAAGSGWMDTWQLVGMGSTVLTRVAYSDVSVVRTEVDLVDPSAATWQHLWDAQDWNAAAIAPQPYEMMVPMVDNVHRFAVTSALEIGPDGTVYATFAIGDSSYNTPAQNPSPQTFPTLLLTNAVGPLSGRFTLGGVVRCLDGTVKNPEVTLLTDGRGQWDGLWQGTVVAGTNHIISLNFDWKEWRFKLAFWEDTFSGPGPAAVAPANGATGIGSLMADTSVSAPISWQTQTGATLYEWQVSEDAAFTSPKTGTSSGTSVTIAGLQAQTAYFWRVRAIEPTLGKWSTVQQFTSVPGGDSGAPAAGKPEDGSTITDTTPLFTWGKIASATNYELQVATSPTFGAADIVIDKTLGDVSAYEADKELVNGTYYWRVRGTNPATDTETPWSFGSFTLDTEAEGQGTPVWVWILIIVGVLLAVVVLVLILRTRRPV
jgi:hypothetical protein